eukprot:1305805-Pleurochrysis_carterae.AAC.1
MTELWSTSCCAQVRSPHRANASSAYLCDRVQFRSVSQSDELASLIFVRLRNASCWKQRTPRSTFVQGALEAA